MTSIKFHLKPSCKAGPASGTLFIRIIHNRKYRDLKRDYLLYPGEWNATTTSIVFPGVANPARNEQLIRMDASMQEDLARIRNIVHRLSNRGPYSVTDIVEEFYKTGKNDTVATYADILGRELLAHGRVRTARAYRSAARSLVKFNGGKDVLLCEISAPMLRSFERYLLDCGLQMNTVSFYIRNIRAVYYRAVKAGIVDRTDANHFEDVYTGVYETRRRALDQQEITALAALQSALPAEKAHLKRSLLYFLFAYHSRGMSFIDMAYLKKQDIKGDTIIYKRKKTGYYLELKITKPMKRIINSFRHQTKHSPYVFPILDPSVPDHRMQYESALNRQNKFLKILASMAGVDKRISTHVARHTWATFAKRLGYGISLISEGLGHRDPKVTSIYLASFERSALDELSTKISGMVQVA
ncbi:MAG: site-specific integrase [Alistipes sp.]|nr:site-specific integrase [Alistipes sp.]